MDKAKEAIRDFTSKSGHHDTTVHSATAPIVKHETVKPQQHENINTAVSREVHQDHYHNTVQPIRDQEVLPEQHHHKLGGVEHREFDHRNHEETRRQLAAETEGFQNERVVHDTTHTKSHAPVVEGEHVHHHIHETIQPVLHKETIQPHIIHTTVPIHETHHNKAQHHQATTLPAVNLSDYLREGGTLHGREERFDNFKGAPQDTGGAAQALHRSHESTRDPITGTFHGDFNEEGGKESGFAHHVSPDDKTMAGGPMTGGHNTMPPTSSTSRGSNGATEATGATGGAAAAAAARAIKHSRDPAARTTGANTTDDTIGHRRGDSGKSGFTDGVESSSSHDKTTNTTTQPHKGPGLLNRLDPRVDANGDGKAGFLS